MNINYSLFNEVVKNKNFNVYKPSVPVILGSVINIDGKETPIKKEMSVSYLTFYFYLVQLCNAGILNSDKYIQTLIFWKSLWKELSFFNNTNKNNSVKINSSSVDEVKINQLNKSSLTNRFYIIRDNIYVYCENKNILFAVKTTDDFVSFLEKQIRKIIYQFDKKINGADANENTKEKIKKKIENYMKESSNENVFELMKNPVIIDSQYITLRWKYPNYNSNIKFIFTINPVPNNFVLDTPIDYTKIVDGKYEFTFIPEKNKKIFEVKFNNDNSIKENDKYTLSISDNNKTLQTEFIKNSTIYRQHKYDVGVDFNTFGVSIMNLNINKINKNINKSIIDLINKELLKGYNLYIFFQFDIPYNNYSKNIPNIKNIANETISKIYKILLSFGLDCKVVLYSTINYHNSDLPTNLIDTLKNYKISKFYSSNKEQLETIKNAKIESLQEAFSNTYRLFYVSSDEIAHL